MIPRQEENKLTNIMHVKSRQTGHGQAKVNGTKWPLHFLHTHAHKQTHFITIFVILPSFIYPPKNTAPLVPVSKKKNFLPSGLL